MSQSEPNDRSAFVDAYGDTSLELLNPGVTSHFIISAVLVSSDQVDAARSRAQEIHESLFGADNATSSQLSDSDRLKCLAAIDPIPFRFRSVVVDKRAIDPRGGLQFHGSFLKFLHGVLFKRLFATSFRTRLIVDSTDRDEFMDGLRDYVEKRYQPDIFHRHPEFASALRKDEPLIQLAGFISGSLARVFEPKTRGAVATDILGALREKAVSIDEWPRPTTPPSFDESTATATDYDKQVYEYCVERVWTFINQRSHSVEEDVLRQVAVAEYLLHHLRFENAETYVQLSTLVEDLGLSGDMIRRNVIAGLRDYGVLIASSSRGGYKIPSCAKDLQDYVRMASELICPLLRRVGEARKALYAKTNKKLDIVGGPESEQLRELLATLEGER